MLQIVKTIREPFVVLDGSLKVISASNNFYKEFQLKPEEIIGCYIVKMADGLWDIPTLRELLETILPRDETLEKYLMDCNFPNIGHRKLSLNACRITGNAGLKLILLSMEIIS